MPKFDVSVSYTLTKIFEVEADDATAAEEVLLASSDLEPVETIEGDDVHYEVTKTVDTGLRGWAETFATYRPHFREYAEGHIFLDKPGACNITLSGAASMTQAELDEYGRTFAAALNESES